MKRYGQIIGVKPEHFEEYKKYHAAVWPEVLKMITLCNIRNYSIFHKDNQLFIAELEHLQFMVHGFNLASGKTPKINYDIYNKEETEANLDKCLQALRDIL
jgi:hypothetical protein